MNDLDKIYEEAAEQLTKARYSGELHFQALAVNLIKSACEKALKWQRDYYGYVLPNPLLRAAHRVEKDAAGASDDNCRKCGRPLGWFEPGLCDNCRAGQAVKPKPLERCSSNPHYEAHFGDEPATTAHASEQP